MVCFIMMIWVYDLEFHVYGGYLYFCFWGEGETHVVFCFWKREGEFLVFVLYVFYFGSLFQQHWTVRLIVSIVVPVGELAEGGAGHGQEFSFFKGLYEILGLVDKSMILFCKIVKFILNAVLLIFFLEVGDHFTI